jgi:hypothetical protein
MYKCSYCNYFSDRKYNLQRHIHIKHDDKLQKKDNVNFEQNVCQNEQNVCQNEQNVCPFEQNVCPFEQNVCPKCNKLYKTRKHLLNHQNKCNGIDELTCSKCMKSFTTRAAKHKHIKAGKCKARSIIHARTPNVQNITNIGTIQNAETINNVYINNFGSERIDHISKDEIFKILTSGINTIPLYIEKKHFDKNFPENNNIAFTNENKCKVLENNIWKEKDLGILSSKLIQDNSAVLLLYCEDNEKELANYIQNDEVFDHVKDKLIIVYNKADRNKYNEVFKKIQDLVKNCKK